MELESALPMIRRFCDERGGGGINLSFYAGKDPAAFCFRNWIVFDRSFIFFHDADTILRAAAHELGHFLTKCDSHKQGINIDGHGQEWRAVAESIGAEPYRDFEFDPVFADMLRRIRMHPEQAEAARKYRLDVARELNERTESGWIGIDDCPGFLLSPKIEKQPTTDSDWNLRPRLINGLKRFELRNAGAITLLPKDRNEWPPDARAVMDRIDEIDKARRECSPGGCLRHFTDYPVRYTGGSR